jgi:hypothetical protein
MTKEIVRGRFNVQTKALPVGLIASFIKLTVNVKNVDKVYSQVH